MLDGTHRAAQDPDAIRATAGLVNYLRELVLTARRPIRDCAQYEEHVWLAHLPVGVNRPAERDDGVILTLDYVPRAAPPEPPSVLAGWIDPDSLDDPTRQDPPLADEGPGAVWYRNLVHASAQLRIGDVPDADTFKVCWYVAVAALNDLAATQTTR